jgi:hypothetical protein
MTLKEHSITAGFFNVLTSKQFGSSGFAVVLAAERESSDVSFVCHGLTVLFHKYT